MGNVCSCYEGDTGEAQYGIGSTVKRHGSTATIMKKRAVKECQEMCDQLNRSGKCFTDYEFPATLDTI